MKKKLSTIAIALVFLLGAGLLLYPTVSDSINALHQSRAIAAYADAVEELDAGRCQEILAAAQAYNTALARTPQRLALTESETAQYESLLNLDGTGVMATVEIPAIHVSLPVYHGTEDVVLQQAVGHLAWTSLPVGGESTHSVLSGHRGLPSAKLFTDLDKLELGDTFLVRVLDEVLTYEVDQILTVEPQETAALEIVPGMDYCTLMTCTPYGINTHRLLVRGHRIENAADAQPIVETAASGRGGAVWPVFLAGGAALAVLLFILIRQKKRRKKEEDV